MNAELIPTGYPKLFIQSDRGRGWILTAHGERLGYLPTYRDALERACRCAAMRQRRDKADRYHAVAMRRWHASR